MLRAPYPKNPNSTGRQGHQDCNRTEQKGLVCEQACLRQMGGARRWMLLQMATCAQRPSASLL